MLLKNTPIRRKLMTVNLLTSGAVLLLTCLAFFAYEVLTFRQTTVQQLSTLGNVIAANSTAALAFDDHAAASETLAAFRAEPHIVAASLYDANGKLFSQYPANSSASAFPATPGGDEYHFEQGYMAGFLPVMQGNRRLGTLYIKSDMAAIYEQLRRRGEIAALVMVISLLLAYLLSRALQKQISTPVLALAETANAVSKQRDYSVRAKKFDEDELGSLTDAFNQMLASIQERESALRKSEAQLQTVVESLDEGVVVSDIHGQILHFNRAALAMHGFASSKEIHIHLNQFGDIFELSALDGTVWPVDQWPLARVLRGETLRDLEVRIRRIQSDGWQRIFCYGGTLVRDPAGRPLMGVITINDITERKAAEEKIRQLNVGLEQRVAERTAELQAANQELEAFSYSVSHDLRAPLRAVDGFSQAVQEDYAALLPEEGRRYLQTIREGAQRMGVLIDDLLTFSRLSRAALSRQTVNTDKLAREVIEELNPRQLGRQIEIHVGKLPPCQGDAALLKQVWINLLSNAFKYTRNRNPAVIEIGCARENGGNVYFVRDNGAGFDMKYAHKLFGVFQRLHRADEYEGTGVGLAIVQRVIHRHGGQVWAVAAPDHGAAFYFNLKGETTS
ncbi:MAG TPA: ATP-binding protein [Candidatus Aquilonibacter sp.]|nr:ATP-binding protein [Candidatus Aquilonibacter sp.]